MFYLHLLGSYWQVLTVKAVCEMNLPDELNAGPVSIAELAQRTKLHPQALYRVMRALANVGVFAEVTPRTFAHTPLSELLRSDLPQSFRWMVLSEFGAERVPAWMNLPQSIRTGEIAFDHAYEGKDIWDYYRRNPEKGEYFARWMTGMSHVVNNAILEAFDFSPYNTIVDVAGGQGAFLESILAKNPSAQGILFDLPMVIDALPDRPRIRRVAGDAFASVPEGGDLYLLKWIIHDWEESKALLILNNIRRAMNPGGSLIVVEGLVSEGPDMDFMKWMDINMLVMTGGEERTGSEYRELLFKAGFHLDRVVRTAALPSIVVASPA